MARRKSRFFLGLIVIAIISIFAYFAVGYFLNEKEEDKSASSDSWLTVIETDVKYRQQSKTVDMLKGVIKANEQVDKIFVNINGLGVQYLEFTPSLIQTTTSTYIAHNIAPIDELCSVGVVESQTVTVDLYVEYQGRSFKVDTQKVAIESSELKVLKTNISYKEGAMSVSMNNGFVETNVQIDKIFVNINGVGTQYVTFTSYEHTTESGQLYYLNEIKEVDDICATVFGSDSTVTVDLYIEYNGRAYKVDTQEVEVKCAWTPFY